MSTTQAQFPQIIEYGNPLSEHSSVKTALRRERRQNDYGRVTEWTLNHSTKGYVPAGSMMRYQAYDIYSVNFDMGGATHGRAFLTLPEAEAYLESTGDLVAD